MESRACSFSDNSVVSFDVTMGVEGEEMGNRKCNFHLAIDMSRFVSWMSGHETILITSCSLVPYRLSLHYSQLSRV